MFQQRLPQPERPLDRNLARGLVHMNENFMGRLLDNHSCILSPLPIEAENPIPDSQSQHTGEVVNFFWVVKGNRFALDTGRSNHKAVHAGRNGGLFGELEQRGIEPRASTVRLSRSPS